MKSDVLQLNNISFAYDSFTNPIFKSVTLNLYSGWTGIIGPNGTGKTTFLKLCVKALTVQKGTINSPQLSVYCEQKTDELPRNIENFIYSYDKDAVKLKNILEINEEFITRWETLSHGERKKLQIGYAIYQKPDLFAIDEPTNHLDCDAKKIIKKSLLEYKGIGLIVSHDRELLDSLCLQCIFIDPPDAIIYRGNYTEARKNYEADFQYQKKMRVKLQKETRRIQFIIQHRKEIAQNSDQRVSKKGINSKDHDSKAKIDGARLTGKDAVGGKLLNQMQGRLGHTMAKLDQYQIKKEYRTGIKFFTETSKRNFLFFQESAEIELGVVKKLFIKNLKILPLDKIGLTGKNGSGKTTLVKFIIKHVNLKSDDILYIPQELDIKMINFIRSQINQLNDEKLGQLMAFITRLGSEPKRLLESELYSPGETRKLLFAFGILNHPQLIIMDEPTNHLDIVAIECLENALMEINCALLLVSHDNVFINKLVTIHWNIDQIDHNFILSIRDYHL